MNNTMKNVLKYLNEDIRTRDNDNLLIARIWYSEMANKELSAIDFLKMYAEKSFSSAESIRRCRQKLQEEYQGLRGNSYMARHKTNYKQIFV